MEIDLLTMDAWFTFSAKEISRWEFEVFSQKGEEMREVAVNIVFTVKETKLEKV